MKSLKRRLNCQFPTHPDELARSGPVGGKKAILGRNVCGLAMTAPAPEINSGQPDGPPALKVIIRQPAGNYNRYEWDEGQQAIVLAERVWHFDQKQQLFEVASVPGTLSQRGAELGVLIPCDLSDIPGAVVTVRVIGMASLTPGGNFPTHHFLVAVPLADPLFATVRSIDELLPTWRAEVENRLTLSSSSLIEATNSEKNSSADHFSEAYRQPPKISWQTEKEAWEIVGKTRRAFRLAQANSRGPGQTGRNW